MWLANQFTADLTAKIDWIVTNLSDWNIKVLKAISRAAWPIFWGFFCIISLIQWLQLTELGSNFVLLSFCRMILRLWIAAENKKRQNSLKKFVSSRKFSCKSIEFAVNSRKLSENGSKLYRNGSSQFRSHSVALVLLLGVKITTSKDRIVKILVF